MLKRERLDRRLDSLEGKIVELTTSSRRQQFKQEQRIAALEGAIERLIRKARTSTSKLRETAMGRELGKFVSRPEKQKFSLPEDVNLRTLCTAELLEIGKRMGLPTSPTLHRSEMIEVIRSGDIGTVEHLSTERKRIAALMSYEKAISSQMPCDINCTAGCPDAMVAACHFDNHPIYLRVFPEKSQED